MDNLIEEPKNIEQLVGILLNECQTKETVHLSYCLEILKQLQCHDKDISIDLKVSIERSFLRIMHYYLEITCEHIQNTDITIAELLGAMLQTFSSLLQISDFELIPFILSQNKAKKTRGLFLLRAITRNISKLPAKELAHLAPLWQYKRAAARLFGESEVFDCIINKFSDKKQNKNFFTVASHIHSAIFDVNTEYYAHRVIVECLVQMKENLNSKQRKQAYEFLRSALPILPSLIEINIDITFPYFSLLRQVNPHFQAGKEIEVFNSFSTYLRHFQPIIGEESRDNWKTVMSPAIDSMNLGVSIFEDVITSSSLKSDSCFISAMVDYMFAMCELDFIFFEDSDFYALGESIGSSTTSANQTSSGTNKNGQKPDNMEHDQVFVDFQYHLESISQSRKKTFLNDHLFENITKFFTSEQDNRRVLGCYNMLYYQTKFNADPIRLVLSTVMKFIPRHLKTQQLFCYAVRFLFQMAMSAINYLTPHHEQFMPLVIQTACIAEDGKISQNIDQLRRLAQGDIFIGLSLIERVFSRIVYEEDFALFDYIPGVYQFCLQKCNSPGFFQKPSYFQELVRHLINCILHKKKVENYIAPFVQESKQVFLAPLEDKDISATPSLATGLSCLSCLAKMVLKSENCKDDDLVRRVKQLLLYYSKLVHNGNFDHSNYLRTEIYQFIYSIQMDQLEDQPFVEKLFLYLYKPLLRDCCLNTNVTLIKRNGNHYGVHNPQNHEDHEGQMFQQEELIDYIGNNNHNNQQNPGFPAGQQVQQNMQLEHPDEEGDEFDEEDGSDISDGMLGENIVNLDIENFLNEDDEDGNNAGDFEDEDDDAENENYEQFYFEPPNVELVDLKSHALYLLGDFMDVCIELVMDYKKFEIVDILKKNSLHDREENSIIYMNYQTIGQMLLCAHTYFSKFHSELYLTPVNNNSAESKKLPKTVISEEAKVELDPLVVLTLASIDNLDKVNDDNIHEEMLAKLSYVLRHLDVNGKQSYFTQYFKTIRKNIRKTLYLSQSSLLDKQMECLQSIFKAAPFEIPEHFNQIWEIFQNHFFYSFEDKTVKEEIPNLWIKQASSSSSSKSNSIKSAGLGKGDNKTIHNASSKKETAGMKDNNEDDWEEVSEDEDNVHASDKHSKQKPTNSIKPIRLARDLSQIHSFVGFVSHFIKYHSCVYEIVSPVMNQILLGTTVLQDEILLRNSIYFMNVATRYCYDSIPADVFNNIFKILSILITQQKAHTFEEKGSLENIYITYALMASKMLETNRNEYASNNIDNTSQPFKVLLSALPFESDFAEMKRAMQVVQFLFEKQSPLIIQYLQNIVSSIVHIVNEPLRYKIKKIQTIVQLFELIKHKFPQAENIVRAILIRNENNHFKSPRTLLGLLKMQN